MDEAVFTAMLARVSGISTIRALRAAPGHTLFEFLGDAVVLAEPGSGRAAELVVLPNAAPGRLDKSVRRAETLNPGLWERARASGALVVLDASTEGAEADAGIVDQIHGLLRVAQVGAERAIYVTQDRRFAADYERLCASEGRRPAFSVLAYDYWPRALTDSFSEHGAEIFEARLQSFRARPQRRARRFLSQNLTPRPSKLAFLTSVLRDGLWDRGHISFGGLDSRADKGKTAEGVRNSFLEDPHFGAMARASRPELDRLDAMGEVLLGGGFGSRSAAGRPKFTNDVPLPEYGDCWFSVVTETEMRGRPSRITEKPFKPIANFHPLLMLGNPGALAFLRELGFQTFPELFDETYDEEPGPGRRFDLVYRQFAALCRLDEGELGRRVGALSEVLEFNARHLMTRLPQAWKTRIDRPFLASLRAAIEGASGAPRP